MVATAAKVLIFFGLALKYLCRLFAINPTNVFVVNVDYLLRELCNCNQFEEDVRAGSVQKLLWQHQHIFWKYLGCIKIKFAWKLRKEAALLLHDLGKIADYDDIRQKLMSLHHSAQRTYVQIEHKKVEPSSEYMVHARSPLSFKAIQYNAAIVGGDVQWLVGETPQTINPRMFCIRDCESTPEAPSESSD